MLEVETWILMSGVLLFVGVLASKLSDWVGVPALLLFLAVGMLAGSEGLGGIAFDSAEVAQAVGTVALVVILYSGGLDTNWSAVRPVLVPGLLLSTVGVCVTTLMLGGFAWFMLGEFSRFNIGAVGLTWLEALLLAAIVSSTDAAAVFSVFRTSPVQPLKRIRYLLEFESGSNDPMAVLLTTVILGLMTFGIADAIGGNGFLAVYAAGLVIGNRLKVGREVVGPFHDGLSWLMQIAMFIVLGLLVFPSGLLPVAGVAIALALFLMFVARPVSVFLCLLPFRKPRNEIGYVSWVGLRGSVPIVLATFPASFGIAGADAIFNVVFFIVLTSVLLQGMTLVPSTRWFGVTQG